jgi:hypothetical protein
LHKEFPVELKIGRQTAPDLINWASSRKQRGRPKGGLSAALIGLVIRLR